MSTARYFIGLMSGTSADAVDAVLLDFQDDAVTITAHYSEPLNSELRQQITQLCTPGEDNLDLLGKVDSALGEAFAHAALALLDTAQIPVTAIAAIGSHGQTVRHRPPTTDQQPGFTLQIGDPNIIAARTGITTIADFRRKDMALGGQGAPLAPAFHQQVFSSPINPRAVINLGGIANVTWLPCTGPVLGFDTGPSNTLMDYWCHKHNGQPYDNNGQWAASGQVIAELLNQLMSHPYLQRDIPKSTGREEFCPAWLESQLAHHTHRQPEDIQATLCQFTVEAVALGLSRLPGTAKEIYLCGGGVFNQHLVASLQARLPDTRIEPTSVLGITPMEVEGATFAWLAKRTLEHLTGSLASVTGAKEDALLGGIYFP